MRSRPRACVGAHAGAHRPRHRRVRPHCRDHVHALPPPAAHVRHLHRLQRDVAHARAPQVVRDTLRCVVARGGGGGGGPAPPRFPHPRGRRQRVVQHHGFIGLRGSGRRRVSRPRGAGAAAGARTRVVLNVGFAPPAPIAFSLMYTPRGFASPAPHAHQQARRPPVRPLRAPVEMQTNGNSSTQATPTAYSAILRPSGFRQPRRSHQAQRCATYDALRARLAPSRSRIPPIRPARITCTLGAPSARKPPAHW